MRAGEWFSARFIREAIVYGLLAHLLLFEDNFLAHMLWYIFAMAVLLLSGSSAAHAKI